MKVSIVIPVYNEVSTIEEIIRRVKEIPLDKEIIVVDDGSSDGTKEKLQNLKADELKVFYHQKNQGKGAALRTGFKNCQGDIIITQDADLEYDPREYHTLLEPIYKGVADVVYGSRLAGGKPQRVYLFWHKCGNCLLTLLTNILYNNTLSDMETGYKIFRKSVLNSFTIRSNGFSVEPEITAKVFKRNWRVYEIPISYYGRTYREGKKITWRQGVTAIATLLWYRIFD
jgi:glycosyltransferase involved in cell wall biosynthesis